MAGGEGDGEVGTGPGVGYLCKFCSSEGSPVRVCGTETCDWPRDWLSWLEGGGGEWERGACESEVEKVVAGAGGGYVGPAPPAVCLRGKLGEVVDVGGSGWRVSVYGLDERSVVYSAGGG